MLSDTNSRVWPIYMAYVATTKFVIEQINHFVQCISVAEDGPRTETFYVIVKVNTMLICSITKLSILVKNTNIIG